MNSQPHGYLPQDLHRLLLIGALPQVYALGMVLGSTIAGYDRIFSVLGKYLPPLTDAFFPMASPSRLVPGCALAILLAVIACLPTDFAPRFRAAFIRLIGTLATAGLVLGVAAVCLPLVTLCRCGESLGPAWWAERGWLLLAITVLAPPAACLMFRGRLYSKAFPVWECLHLLLFALVLIVGIDGAREQRTLWTGGDLRETASVRRLEMMGSHLDAVVPAIPAILLCASALTVLIIGWKKSTSPHRRFGPYFVLAISTLTTLVAAYKLCPVGWRA